MLEVSNGPNTVLLIKDQRACQGCRRCEILYCMIKRLCMSEVSKVVFVAFTQHCIQSTVTHVGGVKGCTLYTMASHPARREGYFSLPSWGFSCSPLVSPRRQLCSVLCTCQLQGWLQARCTANPQFLKLKGAQQPGNSYISMGTKLHPPYPNQDCLPVFWSKKCLQCLKNVGLYNSFGIDRFSLWQSWLTRASRLASSQASASKAGVPGDPNSPEPNCSYLALIWSVKELYSLCASCTVNNETVFGMNDQVISM